MKVYSLLFSVFVISFSFTQEVEQQTKTNFTYNNKGWNLSSGNNYLIQLQFRFQFRASFYDKNPTYFIKEEDNLNQTFNIQRARIKIGGYAYKAYIKYYLEYDFPSNNLLNLEFTFSKYRAIQFKIGQWKVNYNTERFISSGKQQLVERSISNRYFTVDRQIGLMVQGNLFDGKIGSSKYHLGIFNGSGIGNQNTNNHFMYFARYQWNLSRKATSSSFSDLNRAKKLEGFIALSTIYNNSQFTAFSSSGGGDLPGFIGTEKNQFEITQLGAELFIKYKGFSLTSENHYKYITDKVLNNKSTLLGGYIMAGYFFNEIIDFVPKQLELVARYGLVENYIISNISLTEYSIGFNWFFNEHRNKLSVDFSYLENIDFFLNKDNYRLRFQWDISF